MKRERRWNRGRGLIGIAAVLALLIVAVGGAGTAHAAAPPLLSQFCKSTGSPLGQDCRIPRGIGVNEATGHLYVGDQENLRIVEFTAWGEFVRAWGWDVVASGPGENGTAFEVCVPADGDECKAGTSGTGAGQFKSGASGVAVDPVSGDVYVVDRGIGLTGERVQKFSPAGEFLLMFGGGVNQGPLHPGNLCTAQHIAEGDTCGTGTVGNPGPGEGQFGSWPIAGFIDVGPDRTVYVGDQERIQLFAPGGTYKSTIPLPGKGYVSVLTLTSSGSLYAGFASSPVALEPKPNVLKLGPAGETLCTIAAAKPTAVATGNDGSVYVLDGITSPSLRKFSPACAEDAAFKFAPGVGFSTGLATSSACGVGGTNFLVSNSVSGSGFINHFGTAPDPDACPPPSDPPSITAQFATAADSGGATLKARINPHFWADTRYYVEYGTGKCSEGGCDQQQPSAPGSLLTKEVKDAEIFSADVFLEGLEPSTTYHYRFVAESGGGGPVRGLGGTEAVDGSEGTFHTLPLDTEAGTGCPNQAFRSGAAAKLPDCRAYELVSPLDKNNGDVATVAGGFAALDGGRFAFSSPIAFAGPEAAPLLSQYLAERRPGQEWSTRSIALPRDTQNLYPNVGNSEIQYHAFSESLCSGWAVQGNDIALVPGAPAGVPNLYRRDLCDPVGYELLTSTPPPGFGREVESTYYPEIQGASADEAHSVFRTNAALAVSESSPQPPFFCTTKSSAPSVSYQWLRDGVPIPGATASTYVQTAEDQGTAVQCQVSAGSSEGTAVQASEPQMVAPLGAERAPRLQRLKSSSAQDFFEAMATGAKVSGTPAVGQALSCEPGEWFGTPAYSYRWLRNGTAIGGAEASTYVPVSADAGKAVQCELAATNSGGSVVADSPVLQVDASPPSPSPAPSISGTATAGQVLTCDPGTWPGGPTLTYQWLRNGANIAGATASTYTLVAADEGKTVHCRVAASGTEPSVAALSAGVAVAPPPGTPPALTAAGAVTGDALVGEALACEAGTWSGTPAFSRRWLRGGANVAGQAGETYVLTATDLGKEIQCQVTATASGATETALSAPRYVNVAAPEVPGARAYSTYQVYESSPDGTLRLISVLPDGTPALTHSAAGTKQGGEGTSKEDSLFNAVSADGERVFWTASTEDNPVPNFGSGGSQFGTLYLRINATQPQSAVLAGECTEAGKACTVAISADPGARFIAADPQGTRVIYTLGSTLGSDSFGAELFEAEIEEAGGQVLATATPIADDVLGVMGTSEDATRVYFASKDVLGGANSRGEEAVAGKPNLYLHEAGAGFTFVATLSGKDISHGLSGFGYLAAISTDPSLRGSRVSPSGLQAAFFTVAPITGYDNVDAVSGQPDGEVYLYDATAGGAGELVCVSCRRSGARPRGKEIAPSGSPASEPGMWAAATLPPWVTQTHPGSVLSGNGKRLFFESFDSLVPGDANGRTDAYEWEAAGEGGCTGTSAAFSEANGGCIYLISSGESAQNSVLLDATPSGSDVFFTTQSSLLAQDFGLNDVYDARIDGGLPGPVPPPPSCEGEACQGTPEPLNDPTPASSAFQGAGNVKEAGAAKPRCAKGKARKKGRCVKKKQKAAKNRAKADRRAGR